MRSTGRGRGVKLAPAPAPEGAPPIRSPWNFFLPVFALSIPFWLAGGMPDLQWMPGLSVSALMTFCPMAGVNVAVYGLMRWWDRPLPASQFQVPAAALMFAAFFVGALGEELGWSGYITDPMQQ